MAFGSKVRAEGGEACASAPLGLDGGWVTGIPGAALRSTPGYLLPALRALAAVGG